MKKILILTMLLFCFITTSFAADIKPALIETFGNEGGKQCLKSDPGNQYPNGTWGCTIFGASPRSYPNLPKDATIDDVAKLYKRDFWDALHLSEVNSQIVANALFDAAINQGEETWEKKLKEGLQEVINLSTEPGMCNITVDGSIGPKTIALLNKVDQVELYVNLIGLQYERYHVIVKKNPKMKVWYKGWLYRVMRTVSKAVRERDARLAAKKR